MCVVLCSAQWLVGWWCLPSTRRFPLPKPDRLTDEHRPTTKHTHTHIDTTHTSQHDGADFIDDISQSKLMVLNRIGMRLECCWCVSLCVVCVNVVKFLQPAR